MGGVSASISQPHIHLRVSCDFLKETAQFSYSVDGTTFLPLGAELIMVFQLKTFQGIRYALFAYNDAGESGGHADFDDFQVDEPHPSGLFRPIPAGQTIEIRSKDAVIGQVSVSSLTLGRVALKDTEGFWSIDTDHRLVRAEKAESAAEQFQWMETVTGDLLLMSLTTNRFLRSSADGVPMADAAGPLPDNADGTGLNWKISPEP